MNSSYKIGLVLAVLLCAGVVLFYSTQDGGPTVDVADDRTTADDAPASEDSQSPRTRRTLASRDDRPTPAPRDDSRRDASESTPSSSNDMMSALRRQVNEANRTAPDENDRTSDSTTNDTASDADSETAPEDAPANAADDNAVTATSGTSPSNGDDTTEDTAENTQDDMPDAAGPGAGIITSDAEDTTASPANRPAVERETARTDTNASRAADTPDRYTIQPGDTFSSLARELFGDERRWVEIAQANPTVDPQRLRAGQEIRLPDTDDMQPLDRSNNDSNSADDPGRAVPYTVQPGDTLSRIASQYYGTGTRWRLIYEANRNRIGSNPNNVRPGTTLLIPPAPNEAE